MAGKQVDNASLDESLSQYEKLAQRQKVHLDAAKRVGDKAGEGTAYRNLGACYYFLGQYDKALEHYEKRLTIAKEIGDKKAKATTYGELGVCYRALGQHSKAVAHQKMRITIAKQIGDKEGEGAAYSDLGDCYYFLGQYDKALEHYEKRRATAKEIGDKKSQATAHGNLGVCYRALSQYSEAIAHQKMRVTIAKQIGDKEGEGAAYGDLGTCYHAIGQYNKAIENQEMRLNIAKQIGDKEGEGAANGNLGVCYHSLGLFRKALEYHEVSLAIAELTGSKRDEGSCYDNLAVCYHSLGQYDKAIENQEKGLAIAKELGDKAGEGTGYGNLASCYYVRGQFCDAIEHFLMQMTIAKQTGNKASERSAHGNLGASFRALGKFGKALEHEEICLAIAEEIGDRAGEGAAHGYLGNCYYSLGQYTKAIVHYELRLTVAEEIGDKKGEGSAYGNLCACYYSLGQYEKAIEHNERHLKIAEQIEDKASEGVVYGNLGACYRAIGQHSKAAEYHEKALNIAKQIGNKKSEGIACRNLGACYACLNEYSKAIEHYEMSLAIAQQIGDTEVEGAAYASLGACYHSLCQYAKAESNCLKSIECHERLFENAPKQDQFKVSILDTFTSTYGLLLRILLVQGKREEALVLAERGRSQALADLISKTIHPATYGDAEEKKILDFHEICEVVATLESTVLYFRLLSPEICTWVIKPNDDLLFKRTCSRNAPQELISDVQNLNSLIAKSGEFIRSSCTVECEDRSLSFLYAEEENTPKQTKNKERSVPSSGSTPAASPVSKPGLPQDGTSCTTTTQSEYATTSSRHLPEREYHKTQEEPQKPTLKSLLKDMYQIVLAPVQQFVKGSAVAVVPDGPIAMVPFAALVDANENYVADSLQVRLVPSLATAKMIKERSQELKDDANPLIVGDPDVGEVEFHGDRKKVPRLPHAKKEAEVIGALLKVQPLTAKKATKRNFLQQFESARLIHIAAHGDIERGEILFASSTSRRNIEDVMLRISDLEGKCTSAKLVVLSCCHSGRGEVRAEGVIGIARAFLGAGAGAVLVALWAVNDEATLYFMRKFYQHLLDGGRTSDALGLTMKAMRETEMFRDPYYWAPFVHIGEDVAPFESTVK